MKLVLIGTVIGLGFGAPSHAQDVSLLSVKVFQEGAVVLATGNMLTGSLHFFPDRDVLKIICAKDSTYTLSAQLVRGFAAKDVPEQQRTGDTFVALLRTFRTFPLPTKKGAPLAWGFYEQLSRGEGPVLLLRREQTEGVDVVISPAAGGANGSPGRGGVAFPIYSTKVKTTLYLGRATGPGPVVALRKSQDVLTYFGRLAPALRAYARQNDLHYTKNVRDLSFLVNYANTLPEAAP